MTDELLRALLDLHNAVAQRVHESPTIRLMIGGKTLDALASIEYQVRHGEDTSRNRQREGNKDAP